MTDGRTHAGLLRCGARDAHRERRADLFSARLLRIGPALERDSRGIIADPPEDSRSSRQKEARHTVSDDG